MTITIRRLSVFNRNAVTLLCIGVALWAYSFLTAAPPRPEQIDNYEKNVLPILQKNCLKCHGGEKTRGGLDLTTRDSILKGGDIGPAFSVDKPAESRILQAINYRDGLEMPPSGKLPAKDIETLTHWVNNGLAMKPSDPMPKSEPVAPKGGVVTPESKNYWAYRPIVGQQPPAVKNSEWVVNPIDAFILAKIENKGLTPAAPADKVALIRRVTYDLVGLPPTPQDVDDFVKDASPTAYEKLVDRLLASPHYGEKWGRHWLDLVRYAESNSYERDGPKPNAWRFRDYVIRSFNDDKPYDRFVREQLAGDEIDREDPDCIIATGYYRLGLWDDEPADPALARADELDDWTGTTAQVFLGMSLNCARCHDHKIDPLPQSDYYQLAAFFQDIEHYSKTRDTHSPFNQTDISPPARRKEYETALKERHDRIAELKQSMTIIEDEAIKKMPAEDQRATETPERENILAKKLKDQLTDEQRTEYDRLRKERQKLASLPRPQRDLALSVNECQKSPAKLHVMIRGNPHVPGAEAPPGFPQVLTDKTPAMPTVTEDSRSSGRRTVLAAWITSADNPLTSRVLANRLWQHHFGKGIVASANDFGKFGTPPTHPELLDWLATEITTGRWKLKRIHKLMVSSNTYRMSAQSSEKGTRLDPENNLLSRFPMRRLSAEELRDSILTATGSLNAAMFGPSVYPKIPKEVLAGQSMPGDGWHTSAPKDANRRSVYVCVKRSLQLPILGQHDQADSDASCPVRYTTNVPTQSLSMLNSEFMQDQSLAFRNRLNREAGDPEARVKLASRLTAGRQATDEEVRRDLAFIARMKKEHGCDDNEAMRHFCLLLLNSNEFVYLD